MQSFADAFELSTWYEDVVGVPPLIQLRGKTPIQPDWARGPRTDPARWREKLHGWHGNVGALTGQLLDVRTRELSRLHLVVVDGDAKVEGWDDSMASLHAQGLPRDTVTTLTGGGGTHLWFASPVAIKKGALRGFPGIDVQAEGAQIVVPYSVHPDSGRTYDFEFGWSIEDVPIATLPEHFIDLFGRGGVAVRGTQGEVDARTDAAVAVLALHFGAHGERRHGSIVELTRPGKDGGVSGTVGALEDPDAFYCFTSNWSPFERDHAYSMRELRQLAGLPSPDVKLAQSIKIAEPRDDWDDPLPFDIDRRSLLPFPVDALPDWLGTYVAQLSDAMETPPDLAASLALGTLSAAAGGRMRVCVNDIWREPVNLFIAVVMASGERKSPVFDAMLQPLREYEAEVAEASVEGIQHATLERTSLLARSKQCMTKAAKSASADTRAQLEADAFDLRLQAELVEVPVSPRLLADDVTPEALAELMARHRGQIAIVSDEAGVFDMMAGRYSKFANLDPYLKGHSGTQLRVDRRSGAPMFVERPALTIAITFQPGVLRDIYGRRENRERGLLARFQFVLPRSLVGQRVMPSKRLHDNVKATYVERMSSIARELAHWHDPLDVFFDAPTYDALHAFAVDVIEPQLQLDGALTHVADYANKLAGAAVRVSGLLHVALDEDREHWRRMITPDTFARAEAIARCWLQHRLAVQAFVRRAPVVDDAEYLLRWALRTEQPTITARDAQHALWRFEKAADVAAALAELIERGWLRAGTQPVSAGGRPRSRPFVLHPRAAQLYGAMTQ